MDAKRLHKTQDLPPSRLKELIAIAKGDKPAPLLIKNTQALDVFSGKFFQTDIAIVGDIIAGICEPGYEGETVVDAENRICVPGFIDTHVHIESSMMTPEVFERCVLAKGTTTAIWDPHEIANVKGSDGIRWALSECEGRLMDIFLMLPSCVPATGSELDFESAPNVLHAKDLMQFKDHPHTLGLAEMMNYPGVIHANDDVLEKLSMFSDRPRDGHCPSLRGKELNAYAAAGISNCHESITLDEAREKLRKGIHVLIREGSCAKNAKTLLPLIDSFTAHVLGLCSDDRNSLDIAQEGHIDAIIREALRMGIDPATIFKLASFSAAQIFGFHFLGAIAPGYQADIVMLDCKEPSHIPDNFSITAVYKKGENISKLRRATKPTQNPFAGQCNVNLHSEFSKQSLQVLSSQANGQIEVNVIGVIDSQIVTTQESQALEVKGGEIFADPRCDVLKVCVVERHKALPSIGVGFIKGFGIKSGAIASCVTHDSHNIIAVGSDDEAIYQAICHLREIDGGICVWENGQKPTSISLEIGGLMSTKPEGELTKEIRDMKAAARNIGCSLAEPFIQLSFMALPVIGDLKITDKGLIDVKNFKKIGIARPTEAMH